MLSRERSPSAIALPTPAPLPPLTSALSRRAALFGAVASSGVLAGSAAASVATARATGGADASLIVQADAFRSLCARENQAWHDLSERRSGRGDARTHGLPGAVPSLPRCWRGAGRDVGANARRARREGGRDAGASRAPARHAGQSLGARGTCRVDHA